MTSHYKRTIFYFSFASLTSSVRILLFWLSLIFKYFETQNLVFVSRERDKSDLLFKLFPLCSELISLSGSFLSFSLSLGWLGLKGVSPLITGSSRQLKEQASVARRVIFDHLNNVGIEKVHFSESLFFAVRSDRQK